jgi:hypothetical protein
MTVRGNKLRELKEQMNGVEDEVFRSFCREIGVDNIRQYEERELRVQEERAQNRMEIDPIKIRLLLMSLPDVAVVLQKLVTVAFYICTQLDVIR